MPSERLAEIEEYCAKPENVENPDCVCLLEGARYNERLENHKANIAWAQKDEPGEEDPGWYYNYKDFKDKREKFKRFITGQSTNVDGYISDFKFYGGPTGGDKENYELLSKLKGKTGRNFDTSFKSYRNENVDGGWGCYVRSNKSKLAFAHRGAKGAIAGGNCENIYKNICQGGGCTMEHIGHDEGGIYNWCDNVGACAKMCSPGIFGEPDCWGKVGNECPDNRLYRCKLNNKGITQIMDAYDEYMSDPEGGNHPGFCSETQSNASESHENNSIFPGNECDKFKEGLPFIGDFELPKPPNLQCCSNSINITDAEADLEDVNQSCSMEQTIQNIETTLPVDGAPLDTGVIESDVDVGEGSAGGESAAASADGASAGGASAGGASAAAPGEAAEEDEKILGLPSNVVYIVGGIIGVILLILIVLLATK